MPGVGQNFQDHYIARISYPVSGTPTVNERSRGVALAGEIVRYLVTGKGMLTYSASLAATSVKVLEESATPDVQCSMAPGSFKDGQIGELDDFPGITAGAWQMRPLSRGYVEAKSNDPREAPAINPRYLSEQTDRRAIIGGLRFVRRLFAAPALAKYCGAEILPGTAVQTDDELARLRAAATARPSITRPAPARWAATARPSSTRRSACAASRGRCGSSTRRSCRRLVGGNTNAPKPAITAPPPPTPKLLANTLLCRAPRGSLA